MLLLLIIVILLVCCGGGGYWGYHYYYGPRQIGPEPYDTFTPNPYPGTPNNPEMLTPPSTSTSHIDGRTIVSTTTFGSDVPGMPLPAPTSYEVDPTATTPFSGNLLWIVLVVVLVLLLAGGGFWGYEHGYHTLRL